jgi:formamidopyrimidine-DNA glycosylase
MVMMPHAERSEHPLFRGLGVEPLGPELTADYLAARARGKKANLKAFLMDQRIVAGLGNIYVSEALFRAGLSPNRGARALADRRGLATGRAKALVPAIRDVLERAIAAGGSTLRDYRAADGASGAFQDSFAVYDRTGLPCLRAGCGGEIRRVVHAGRASFYCPRCQR